MPTCAHPDKCSGARDTGAPGSRIRGPRRAGPQSGHVPTHLHLRSPQTHRHTGSHTGSAFGVSLDSGRRAREGGPSKVTRSHFRGGLARHQLWRLPKLTTSQNPPQCQHVHFHGCFLITFCPEGLRVSAPGGARRTQTLGSYHRMRGYRQGVKERGRQAGRWDTGYFRAKPVSVRLDPQSPARWEHLMVLHRQSLTDDELIKGYFRPLTRSPCPASLLSQLPVPIPYTPSWGAGPFFTRPNLSSHLNPCWLPLACTPLRVPYATAFLLLAAPGCQTLPGLRASRRVALCQEYPLLPCPLGQLFPILQDAYQISPATLQFSPRSSPSLSLSPGSDAQQPPMGPGRPCFILLRLSPHSEQAPGAPLSHSSQSLALSK